MRDGFGFGSCEKIIVTNDDGHRSFPGNLHLEELVGLLFGDLKNTVVISIYTKRKVS